MALAVALVLSPQTLASIARAIEGIASVEPCRTVCEAQRRLASTSATIFFTQRCDADGTSVDELVRELMRTAPHAVVIGVVLRSEDAIEAAMAFGRLQVSGIIREEDQHLRHLVAARLSVASSRARREEIAVLAVQGLPEAAAIIVRNAIIDGDRSRSTEEFAKSLGRDRTTILRRLKTEGRLGPSEVLGWGRLFAAFALLETSFATINDVANTLDFASQSALQNLAHRKTGMWMSDIRQMGGSEALLETFNRLLKK